jgi:hypothetical protein
MHLAFMTIHHPAVLRRMLRPLATSLRKEVLDAVVALRPSEEDEARYHELADKNAESLITQEERAELEDIVSANTLLSLLRHEAQSVLRDQ